MDGHRPVGRPGDPHRSPREAAAAWPGRASSSSPTRYVRSGRGEPVVRVVVGLRDTENRRRAEVAQAQLLSTVAHELRSPLTSVKGFSATLLRRWDRFSDDQKRLMLETIEADADRVTRLIGELLDISRIDAGRLEVRRQPVDLVAVRQQARRADGRQRLRRRAVRRARHRSRCPRSGPTPTGSTRCSATCSRTPCATAAGTVTLTVVPDGRRASDEADGTEAVAVIVSDEGEGIPRGPLPVGLHPVLARHAAAAAPASGSTSSAAWSRPTAGASRSGRPTAAGRCSDLRCPRARPNTSPEAARRGRARAGPPSARGRSRRPTPTHLDSPDSAVTRHPGRIQGIHEMERIDVRTQQVLRPGRGRRAGARAPSTRAVARGARRLRRGRRPGRAQGRPARARRRQEPARPGQPRDRRAAAGRQGRRRQAGRCRPEAGSRPRPGRAAGRARGRARAARSWSRRRSTSRCRSTAARRSPAPAADPPGADRRHVRRHGLGGRRGPRGRGRVVQLRRPQLRRRTTRRGRCRTPSSSTRRRPAWCCAPTPRRCRSAPCSSAARRPTSSARARSSAPTSSTRPTRRSSTRSRGWPSTRA